MRFKKIGTYRETTREGKDFGFHLKAIGKEGRCCQTLSASLLNHGQIGALQQGKEVEIPFILESDLLEKIDS